VAKGIGQGGPLYNGFGAGGYYLYLVCKWVAYGYVCAIGKGLYLLGLAYVAAYDEHEYCCWPREG
jgi:hypothetical protein